MSGPRYLITPSLHSSWRFYHESEDRPKDEFLATLRRERTPPNEAMQLGIDFENDVVSVCNGGGITGGLSLRDKESYEDCVREIAEEVKGGLFQERVMKDIRIRDMDFLLYGKADSVKRDWIRDIKFTKNYDIGKYQRSVQHQLYMFCSDIPNFAYEISDGRSCWRETYHAGPDLGRDLIGNLVAMIDNIMATAEFKELYLAHWQSYDSAPKAAA